MYNFFDKELQEHLEEMRRKYQGGYWGTEQDTTCVSVEVIDDGVNPIYTEKGQIDVIVIEQGATVLLQPRNKRGQNWIEKNIPKDDGFQPNYPTLICEQRYAFGIIGGMMLDGLNVDSVLEEI